MAEQISRIIIKSSTGSETPASGDLHRGELGYSYKSDRLFIGNETDDSNYVIGGRAFFELFNDVVDGNGNAQHGIVYPYNVIIAGPNKDLDELDVKLLKVDGQVLVSSATTLNLFSSIDSLETDNTLPNVTHTQIATSKAIKEYVDEKTDIISDFINNTPLPGQLLVGNDQNKFEYVDITGVVEFNSTGSTTLRPSTVVNSMLESPTINVGLQTVELGGTVVPNLNVDTSGILNINRGGTGRSELAKNQILIGNHLSGIESTDNFTYDVSNNIFNVSNNTSVIIDGTSEFNGNTAYNGNTVTFSNTTSVLIKGPITINDQSTFNVSPTFNQSPVFTDDVHLPKNLTVDKNAYIIGDLYVSGNTVSVEAQRVLVEDNILVLGANNNTDIVDLGFVGQYNGNQYAGIIRSAADDKFYIVDDYSPEPDNTLLNFNETTMLATMRGIFEAKDITIETGNATYLKIDSADVQNLTVGQQLFTNTVDVSNRLDVVNLFPNNTFAQTVTIYDELNLSTLSTSTFSGTIYFDNSDVTVLNNSSFNINGSAYIHNLNSTTITANTYSGIYLNMLENVNATANTDQVLTADGAGNFYFANAATELKELTDVNSTASANEILTAYGNGEFYFSDTAILTSLTTPLVTTDSDLDITAPDGNITLISDYDITIDASTGGNIFLRGQGGAIFAKGNVLPETSGWNIGSNSRPWNILYVNDIQSTGTSTLQTLVATNSTLENITANNITANTYSGIYLDMLENVNSTATANQVLTADGTGNFEFTDLALTNLVDVDSSGSAFDTIMTTDGKGTYYFKKFKDFFKSEYIKEIFEITSTQSEITTNEVLNLDYKINVHLNGLRLLVDNDYTTDHANSKITFANSLLANDVVVVDIFTDIQEYYIHRTVAIGGEQNVAYQHIITSDFLTNVYQNGLRLSQDLYAVDTTNSQVTFTNTLSANDVIEFDFYLSGLTYEHESLTVASASSIISLSSDIEVSDILNLYVNGIRYIDNNTHMFDYDNNQIILNNSVSSSTVIELDIFDNTAKLDGIYLTNSVLVNSVIDCGTF